MQIQDSNDTVVAKDGLSNQSNKELILDNLWESHQTIVPDFILMRTPTFRL
jgi:hypothetical protein